MFEKVTYELTQSVCNNDEESLTNLFADNGVYHDYKKWKSFLEMVQTFFRRWS